MITVNDSSQERSVFLVVGSDTGVGKTVFTGLLGRYLSNTRLRFQLVKPFCSGGIKDIKFLKAANAGIGRAEVNYWYGDKPISPAAWELFTGNQIDFDDVVEKLRQEFNRDDCDILLVEGVGGLLAPITRKHTVASLGQELGSPIIIIAQNRVGVINHVLLTVEAAVSRGLSVASVILMGQEEPDASADNNAELIRTHIPNISGLKGIYEFPWIGEKADNPKLIPVNVKKAESLLDKFFNEVIKPYFTNDSTN